jgi:cytochrome c5
MSDNQFAKAFAGMIGGLIALAVVIFIIANSIAGTVKAAGLTSDDQKVAERIKPIGTLAIAGEQIKSAGETIMNTVVPTASAAADGKATYDGTCMACHAMGVAGAPKFGDKAAWADRIAQGKDTLYKHALEGFQGKSGVMPAKGGRTDLSDDDVKAAVDYMVDAAK